MDEAGRPKEEWGGDRSFGHVLSLGGEDELAGRRGGEGRLAGGGGTRGVCILLKEEERVCAILGYAEFRLAGLSLARLG